jgi:D-alanine transaminase
MARIAYVNGRYRPLAGEAVALEDRGYQFADGVYEVIKVLAGTPRDLERHLDRLERSLAALEIRPPMSRAALATVLLTTLRMNRLRDALLYLQITRGAAPRKHA